MTNKIFDSLSKLLEPFSVFFNPKSKKYIVFLMCLRTQVQSQWVGPYTFSFKAEVDFDGTYLAAQLRSRQVLEWSSL